MTRRRLGIWVLRTLAVVLLLLIAAAAWLLTTASGRDFALERVEAMLPPGSSLGEAEGVLIGPLVLRDVRLTDGEANVAVDRFELDWSLAPLLLSRVRVDHLGIAGVVVELPAGEADPAPVELPEAIPGLELPGELTLPFPIEVSRFELDGLRVVQGGRELGSFALAFGAVHDGETVRVDGLEASTPWGSMAGDFQAEATAPYPMVAQFGWQAEATAATPPLAGTLAVDGPLDGLGLDFEILDPDPARVTGHVDLLAQWLRWDLDLQIGEFNPADWHPDAPPWPARATLALRGDSRESRVVGDIAAHATPVETLDAELDLRVRPRGMAIDDLTLLATAPPARVDLNGRLDWGEGVPDADLDLAWADLAWPAEEPAGVSPRGRLHIVGTSDDYAVSGEIAGGPSEYPDGEWEVALRGGLDALEHWAVDGEWLGAAWQAEGALDWRDDLAAEVDLSWDGLVWPGDEPVVVSERGTLALRGGVDGYTIAGEVLGGPAEEPDGAWQVALSGDDRGLDAWHIAGDWLDAAWRAQGDLDWRQDPGGGFSATIDGLDPQRLGQPVVGDVMATASGDWVWRAGALDADIHLDRLAGEVAGEPLHGSGGVRVRGDEISLDGIRLRAGEALLNADGALLPTPDLRFRAAAPELADLLPRARGSLQADGRVHGALERPGVELDLTGSDLAWGDTAVERMRLNADLPARLDAAAALEAEIEGLRFGDETVEYAHLALAGTLAAHRIDLRLQRAGQIAQSGLRGGLDTDNVWRGEIDRLDLLPDDYPGWVLRTAAPLRLGLDGVRGGPLCLEPLDFSAGQACAEGDWEPGMGWNAWFRAQALPIAPWSALVVPHVAASGRVDIDARAQGGPDGELDIDAIVELAPGYLHLVEVDIDHDNDDRIELLAWQATSLRLTANRERLRASLDMPLDPTGGIEIDFETGIGDGPQPMTGQIAIDSDQLPLLAYLSPEIGRVEGRLDVAAELAGTTHEPRVDGSAELVDGLLTLPQIGLRLTGVAASFAGEPDGLRARLSADSGEGRIEVEALARREAGEWRIDGDISGSDFRAFDTTEGVVDISPAIAWVVRDGEMRVSGRVDVPYARITPRDLGGAVRPTADLERIGDERDAGDNGVAGLEVLTDLDVELGDDVRFDGFGLRGRVSGALRLRDRPGQITTAQGEIEVLDGTYAAYQQQLSIDRGRLIYDGGAVTDPGLDIRAVRRPRNVVVGVVVRGTLQEPRVELFSEPPMQQSQILSYLVIGMPIGEAGDEDRSALAAAMTGAGGWLAGQLGGELGIDDIAIQEGATQDETELVLGTYLHPRLYVSYGVGLFESFTRVRVRYSLGRRWAIEGQSGPSSSGDLIYSIER